MLASRIGLLFFRPPSFCSLLLVSLVAAAPALGQSLGGQLDRVTSRTQPLTDSAPEPVSHREPDADRPANITVGPRDSQTDIQAALDALAPGQLLRMQPGRYVGLALTLARPGVTIEAEGAIMDGAAIEIAGDALTRSGGILTYSGLPAPLDPLPRHLHGGQWRREAPTPELQAREVLWVCDAGDALREVCTRYERQPAGSALGPRQFVTNDRALMVGDDGGNWSRRVLLWPQTPQALDCTAAARGVTIRGLTVRRYAPPFHKSQVDLRPCANMTFERVSIVDSSTIGLEPGDDFTARGSHFDDNGQMAVMGWSSQARFEDSTANRNNHRGFPTGWNAGGVKINAPGSGKPGEPDFVETRLVWIGGEVADNVGIGLWTDGSAADPLIRGAMIRDNTTGGIHLELTFGGLVEGNLLVGNGTICSGDKANGSAIKLQGTSDAVVRNNLVIVSTDCGRGINFRQRKVGYWQTARNEIVDNTIVQVSSDPYGTSGFWILLRGDPSIEDRVHDNQIDRNRYVLAAGDGNRRWRYQTHKPGSGGTLTWEQWQARGHDVNGQVLHVSDPQAWVADALAAAQ